MEHPFFSDQSFFQLLSDAIHFAQAAKSTSDSYKSQRYARSSILSSILTLECAANCCLYNIDAPNRFIGDVEKLNSFSKFDIYARHIGRQYIDRGSHVYLQVAELKRIRDSFVHPKKMKIPIDFSLDEEQLGNHVVMNISFDAHPMPATKIDKSSMFWFDLDAETALKAIFGFYDYYFTELLELDGETILVVLGNILHFSNEKVWLMNQRDIEGELEYIKTIGISQKFLDFSSVHQINVDLPQQHTS